MLRQLESALDAREAIQISHRPCCGPNGTVYTWGQRGSDMLLHAGNLEEIDTLDTYSGD